MLQPPFFFMKGDVMANDFDKLVRKALKDLSDPNKDNNNNPYIEMAEQTAMMFNAFSTVGFSHEEAYELASNILLMQVQGAIDHPAFFDSKKRKEK